MINLIKLISIILGTILYFCLPERRKIANYNIQIILPQISELEKKKLLKKVL